MVIEGKIAKTLRAKNIMKIMLVVLIALAIDVGLIYWVMQSGADDVNDDY